MTLAAKTAPYTYTQDELDQAATIKAWLVDAAMSSAHLARLMGVNQSTLHLVLAGKYVSSPADMLTKASQTIAGLAARGELTAGRIYVPIALTTIVKALCDRARKHGNFAVMTGKVGVGKTAALKHYTHHNAANTVLIEASPNMAPGVLMGKLLTALDVAVPKKLDAKYECLITRLAGSPYLIVIDEAEIMQKLCPHYLRRIRDLTGVGVVLAGTPALKTLLASIDGVFDQITSRTGSNIPTQQGISEDECFAISRILLAGHAPSDTVLSLLFHYARGNNKHASVRMLTENLIPALMDFGLKKRNPVPLDADFVHEVAVKLLHLPAVTLATTKKGGAA